jgi:toxin ParE1/3/4
MQIVWLRRARRDFERQIRHIAEHNIRAAIEQDLLISTAVARLERYPHLGKAGPEKGMRLLVIPHTPFIALYRLATDRNEVHILRVLHTSQKWPPE